MWCACVNVIVLIAQEKSNILYLVEWLEMSIVGDDVYFVVAGVDFAFVVNANRMSNVSHRKSFEQ